LYFCNLSFWVDLYSDQWYVTDYLTDTGSKSISVNIRRSIITNVIVISYLYKMCVYKVLIMYNTCTVSVRNRYNLFVRGLESDRKRSLWQCFAACARTFYFYQQCTCAYYPLQCSKQLPNFLKRAETSIFLIMRIECSNIC
jgi:hypothetical protein